MKRFITCFNLLLMALDSILYVQERREIGLHLLISFAAPFLGISLMIADKKTLR